MMDAKKLVEMVQVEMMRQAFADHELHSRLKDKWLVNRYKQTASAVLRIAIDEAAKKAAVASLGTLKTTSDRIDRAIRSLSPFVGDSEAGGDE